MVIQETFENLVRERNFKERIEGAYGVVLKKLPRSYRFDYLVCNDTPGGLVATAIAELKCREIASNKFETLILSASKWFAALNWLQVRITPLIFVEYTDRSGYFKVTPELVEISRIEWGGRTKKALEADDIEAVIHLPLSHFKELRAESGKD